MNWYIAGSTADEHGFRWHLPTRTELALLYEEKDTVGSVGEVFANSRYWSSTEINSGSARNHDFSNGSSVGITSKGTQLPVRAVREF